MSLVSRLINTVAPSTADRLIARWLPYPRVISIEPTNICNLRCPLCPAGVKKLDYGPTAMSLETFKLVIAKMPFVRVVDLFKAGEPFLNRDIFPMIRHARERGIAVAVSTNFSFCREDRFFDEMVRSGLNRLVVSLDGASQGSYEKYRIGGSYAQVVANLEKLVAAKRRNATGTPEIVWQFLVNRFNEHEIPEARELCREMGISLDVQPMDISDNIPDVELEQSIEERKAYWLDPASKHLVARYRSQLRYPLFPGICNQLFTRAVVTADAKVLPCCESWNEASAFGDLKSQSFRDIWFGPKYMEARRRFFGGPPRPGVDTVCFRCRNYGTTPSSAEKVALLVAILRARLCHGNFTFKSRRLPLPDHVRERPGGAGANADERGTL